MGTVNVKAGQWDATEFDPASGNRADLVIADLPCSGLGIIGRKPDIKYQHDRRKLEGAGKAAAGDPFCCMEVRKAGRSSDLQHLHHQSGWKMQTMPVGSQKIFPLEPVDLTEAVPLKGEAFAGLKENTYPGADLKNGRIQFLPGISPLEDFDGFFISVFRRVTVDISEYWKELLCWT